MSAKADAPSHGRVAPSAAEARGRADASTRQPGGGALLDAVGVSKTYGGIHALEDVSLRVRPGTVHALLGANGAGKSTLIKILAGVEQADAGTVSVAGEPAQIRTTQDAAHLGLAFIHQELNLVPKFTAVQNMAMGYDPPRRAGMVDWGRVRTRATEVMKGLQARVPMDVEVERLSVSDRWMVSLGRSLMRDARLIAMDEPTASFTAEEAEHLFKVVRDLRERGVAILYISHRLAEVVELAQDVTVLRNGRLVESHQDSKYTARQLTRLIIGDDVPELERHHTVIERREPVITIDNLAREPRVKDASLEIRQGEIMGIAGLVGAGRTEFARLIFGADQPTGGTMTLDGKPFAPRSPYDAVRRGVALVPEERRSEALILRESVAFNASLATARRNRWHDGVPLLSMRRSHVAARDIVRRCAIATKSVRQPVVELSGGNQQKVVLGRFVRAQPRLLVLDEPTVGVDVGARAEIHGLIRGLADEGVSVLLISSDFDELQTCDRVAVMREGRITTVMQGERATKESLTHLCYENEGSVR